MPKPRVDDLVEANQLIQEARKYASSGIKISSIPPEALRVGAISDASSGNARESSVLEHSKMILGKQSMHGFVITILLGIHCSTQQPQLMDLTSIPF